MPEVIEIPIELTQFQLPQAVQARLHFLLDRQDEGYALSQAEQQEAEGLVELAEFLSLLHLHLERVVGGEEVILIEHNREIARLIPTLGRRQWLVQTREFRDALNVQGESLSATVIRTRQEERD